MKTNLEFAVRYYGDKVYVDYYNVPMDIYSMDSKSHLIVCEPSEDVAQKIHDHIGTWDFTYATYDEHFSFPVRFLDDVRKCAQSKMDFYIKKCKESGMGDCEVDREWMVYYIGKSSIYTFENRLRWSKSVKDEWGFVWSTLVGMSFAVWQMGFQLGFDSDFKIHVVESLDRVWHTIDTLC